MQYRHNFHKSRKPQFFRENSRQVRGERIDGVFVDWNLERNDRNDLNTNIFCRRGFNIYNPSDFEKVKDLRFYSTDQTLINRYKVNCQPMFFKFSIKKLDEFTNQLWKNKEYEKIFKWFKQMKSLQSLILLDKPKDEHMTCVLDDEFRKAIEDLENPDLSFPILFYNEDLWLKVCFAFFPNFEVEPNFFTFDVCRTLLVIMQHSILTCFQDIYINYLEDLLKEENDEEKTKEEKAERKLTYLERMQSQKKAFVYKKGITLATQIFKCFCRGEYEDIDENVPFAFSLCYLESVDQFRKEPGENGWKIPCLYFEMKNKVKKIKKFKEVEVDFDLYPKDPESPDFKLLISSLVPRVEFLSWDPILHKCNGKSSTITDFKEIFNCKVSDEDRQRIFDSRTDPSVSISDMMLRAFYIRVLMANEIYFRRKDFKQFFIENTYSSTYLMNIRTSSKLTILNNLYAKDSINAGTQLVKSLIQKRIKRNEVTMNEMILELIDEQEMFDSIINSLVSYPDPKTCLSNLFSNLCTLFGLDCQKRFIERFIDYGESVLEISKAYQRVFAEDNMIKYCQALAVCFYMKAFTKPQFKRLFEVSLEQSIHTALELIKTRNENEKMFSIVKDQIFWFFNKLEVDETKITKQAKWSLVEIHELLNQ